MENKNKTVVLAVFGIAMAFVEAAIVIYLRELYYPLGFTISSSADLIRIPSGILSVEIIREIATIIMIATVALLAFQKNKERIVSFLWVFAVWDLFYYLFLYAFLGWPSSLTDLDIYFLVPWPWIGPVWIPLVLFSIIGIFSLWYLLKKK